VAQLLYTTSLYIVVLMLLAPACALRICCLIKHEAKNACHLSHYYAASPSVNWFLHHVFSLVTFYGFISFHRNVLSDVRNVSLVLCFCHAIGLTSS